MIRERFQKMRRLPREACVRAVLVLERHGSLVLFAVGVMLVVGGMVNVSHAAVASATQTTSEANFDDTLIKNSVGMLFRLIEGAFGALVMVVAGIGAIVASAMGAYRAAVGMLVVAVGAFILRALVSLFFGTDFESYEVGDQT